MLIPDSFLTSELLLHAVPIFRVFAFDIGWPSSGPLSQLSSLGLLYFVWPPGTGTNTLNGKSLSSESHNLILIFFFFSVHQWSLIVSWIQWTFSYVFPLSISLLFLNPDSHVVFCDTSQPPCYYSFFIVPLVLGVKLPEKSPAPEPEPRLQPCPHASSPAPMPLALLPHLQPCPLYSNSSIFLPLQRFFFSQDSENNYVFSLLRLSPLLSSSLKIHLFPRSENI